MKTCAVCNAKLQSNNRFGYCPIHYFKSKQHLDNVKAYQKSGKFKVHKRQYQKTDKYRAYQKVYQKAYYHKKHPKARYYNKVIK